MSCNDACINVAAELSVVRTFPAFIFIVTDNKYALKDGKLGDIAPTVLNIMGIDIPTEMTGSILTYVHKS